MLRRCFLAWRAKWRRSLCTAAKWRERASGTVASMARVDNGNARDSSLRLDPELAAISVMIPTFDLNDLASARALERRLSSATREVVAGIDIEDFTVPRADGSEFAVRTYRPPIAGRLPAVLYIHGGAFVLGGLDTEDDRCSHYARQADCLVVALDYRLAPEHPFPAGFDDCWDVLGWMHATAPDLDLDPTRIAVGGNSAGGALAAAVALHARTSEFEPLAHLLLVNPVLDSRSATTSMLRFTDTPSWTSHLNRLMWRLYLGNASGDDYRASPTMADELGGMPPTSIWIAEYDPLRDEAYEFVARLMEAGVSVSVSQRAGTIHGFDGYRMTLAGQRAHREQIDALRRAFRT
jgi:acetyl esterase